MALFPPGRGGGEEVDYGYKGKGVTTHLLVDGNGMPLSVVSTGASVSEREQVSQLIKRVRVYHGYGRPKKCPHEIHADKGYDSKILIIFLRNKGIKPNIPRRVWKARKIQQERFKGKILTNSEMGNVEIREFCQITQEGLDLLKRAISSLNLSARAYHRVLKLSRTIADLSGSENILTGHVAESLQYRSREEG